MILDTRLHSLPEINTNDVCIIGAGCAGITLALQLGRRYGMQVTVMESGGLDYSAKAQSLFEGRTHGDQHPSPSRVRHAGLGGSTELWAGWCRPLDPMDFSKRTWLAHSGWPIDHTDLDDYYRHANAWCGLGSPAYASSHHKDLFAESSLSNDSDLRDSVFHVRRFQFSKAYQAQLSECSNVSLLLHATALRFHVGNNHAAVDSVSVVLGNGQRRSVKAGTFILASGGLENPRLLQLSGDCATTAIGNQQDQVGRYYSEHGFINSGWFTNTSNDRHLRRYFPSPHPHGSCFGIIRNVLSLSEARMADEQLNNAALYFHPAYEAHGVFDTPAVRAALELWEIAKKQAVPGELTSLAADALLGPHHVAHAALRKLFAQNTIPDKWRLRCYFECGPDPHNRVLLDNETDAFGRPRLKVDWRWNAQDLDSARRFHDVVDQELVDSGLGTLSYPAELDQWRDRCETGKHLMGATRMHNSPSQGVVNSDCRVHGTSNLYVAGSSVFPSYGYANPTLTLVALSLRLAEHLGNA